MWLVSENLDSWRQIPFRLENDIAMLHLKRSEGKQLACWEIMSFSASDSIFFPHPSSTYLATPSLCTALVNNWCVIVRNLFFNIFAHSWSSRHCAVDISSPQFGQEGSFPGLPVFTISTLLGVTVHLSCLSLALFQNLDFRRGECKGAGGAN